MTFVETAMERLANRAIMAEVALELRGRWHRAFDAHHRPTSSQFDAGRLSGIETSLALMLGVDTARLRKMLMDEHVTLTSR